MSWYAIDAVNRAVSRTRKALFEPFDFWKWAKLALIIFFVGGIGSNYGSGTNYQMNPEDINNLPDIEPGQIHFPSSNLNLLELKGDHLNSEFSGISGFIQNLIYSDAGFIPDYFSNGISTSVEKVYFSDTSFADYGFFIALIAGFILFILVFSYISSVMEFVFVESLVRNEVKLRSYFTEFMGKGLSLLLVRLAIGLVFLVLIAIAFLPLIPTILEESSDFSVPVFVGGIFWFFGVLILLILFGIVINSFISLAIPLSIYRNTGILSAFRLVFSNFRKSWKEVIIYWFIRFLLGIGIAVLTIFLLAIMVLAFGLIFLIVDGVLYFLFSALVSDPLNWILLVPFILIEIVLIIGVFLFLSVPFAVFMKYHLLSFLETWFIGAEIPFFDAPVQEPENHLNEAEVNSEVNSEVNPEVNSEVNPEVNSEVNSEANLRS
jgi:hypothetical protein